MSSFLIITLIICISLCSFFIYLGKHIKSINQSVETSKDSTIKRVKIFGDDIQRPHFFRRMYLKWNFDWKYLPRDIKIGFNNLYRWFKIIWNDRNWDHTFLLSIMKFKIEQMASYHETRQFYVGWENNVKWMRISSNLIDKLIDSYYESEVMDYYSIDVYTKPTEDGKFVEMEFDTTWETLNSYISKYPLQVDKVKEQYKNLTGKQIDFNNVEDKKYFALLLGHHNENRCQTLLFKILNEKLQHWWD